MCSRVLSIAEWLSVVTKISTKLTLVNKKTSIQDTVTIQYAKLPMSGLHFVIQYYHV